MQDFYTLVANDDFVYFVSGDISFDSVPRKSCRFGKDEQDKWLDRARATANKQADRMHKMRANYTTTSPYFQSLSAQEQQKAINKYNTEEANLRNLPFRVVKVTFTEV